MTTEALSPPRVAARGALSRAFAGHAGPLAVVCLALLVPWYLGAVWPNAPVLIDGYERRDTESSLARLAGHAIAIERPVLPSPHKVDAEPDRLCCVLNLTSKRALVLPRRFAFL